MTANYDSSDTTSSLAPGATNAGPRQSFRIDVISDVVCPWCLIGKRRLEAAIAASPDLRVSVNWRPYQLDPAVPAGGLDRREYMERKFGSSGKIAGIHERLTAEGAKVGVNFRFDLIRRTPNTLDAHRLIGWAAETGAQDAVVEALFTAFFVEGRDIGDRTVLAEIAGECGLDAEATGRRLASDADIDMVLQSVEQAREIGVTGVPCFILADRLALPGAQDPETIARYMQRIAAKMALGATGAATAGG